MAGCVSASFFQAHSHAGHEARTHREDTIAKDDQVHIDRADADTFHSLFTADSFDNVNPSTLARLGRLRA